MDQSTAIYFFAFGAWRFTDLIVKYPMPTFQLVGHPVLHLDVDKEHGKGERFAVSGPQGDVPEAGADGVDREKALANQFFVFVKHSNPEHS